MSEEALRRIEAARSSGARALDLSGLGLTELPTGRRALPPSLAAVMRGHRAVLAHLRERAALAALLDFLRRLVAAD